jgi:hypothetical protein
MREMPLRVPAAAFPLAAEAGALLACPIPRPLLRVAQPLWKGRPRHPMRTFFAVLRPILKVALFSGSFGRGLLGGLLGAGLFGLLFGHGLLGGLVLLFKLVMGFVRGSRPSFQSAGLGGRPGNGFGQMGASARGAFGGFGAGQAGPRHDTKLEPAEADFAMFEQRLGEIQSAFSAADVDRLRHLATPEMASYFTEELAAKCRKGRGEQDLRREIFARRSCRACASRTPNLPRLRYGFPDRHSGGSDFWQDRLQ